MEELVITNNFEDYILQLDKNEISFQTINDKFNNEDMMNVFLNEYEKNIDNEKDQILKTNKLIKLIKYILLYSKLDYIKYLDLLI